MDTAAIGVAQEEDEEQCVADEDIFDRMGLVLAAITLGLFSRVLGADDPSFRPVMGKRGASGGASAAGSSSNELTTEAASASVTPSRCARALRDGPGHRRGCAGPPGVQAGGRGSTDSLCSGPYRTGVPAPLGGCTSSGT